MYLFVRNVILIKLVFIKTYVPCLGILYSGIMFRFGRNYNLCVEITMQHYMGQLSKWLVASHSKLFGKPGYIQKTYTAVTYGTGKKQSTIVDSIINNGDKHNYVYLFLFLTFW